MRQKISRKNLKRIVSKVLLLFTLLLLLETGVKLSEGEVLGDLRISFFVAPEYPRVARQLMQSGDVVLTVSVDTVGKPSNIIVKAPHALLGESAKETVSRWRFMPLATSHMYPIYIHYGFSGTPRDCNPSTIVTVDLQTPRVTITVDPHPPFGPDAWPESNRKVPQK